MGTFSSIKHLIKAGQTQQRPLRAHNLRRAFFMTSEWIHGQNHISKIFLTHELQPGAVGKEVQRGPQWRSAYGQDVSPGPLSKFQRLEALQSVLGDNLSVQGQSPLVLTDTTPHQDQAVTTVTCAAAQTMPPYSLD